MHLLATAVAEHRHGEHSARVERALHAALACAIDAGTPPTLKAALLHALFPGGARLRPQLCIAVAEACGDPRPEASEAAAAAVELIHCASLVHDDLPCFDDASLRRGRPTVHAAFGDATAVLVGDALIVAAFDLLARRDQTRALGALAAGTGSGRGIIAGQAWESETAVPLDEYHRAKTAALFAAAAEMGALAAGAAPEPWRALGEAAGLAYQAADDLADAIGVERELGKPTGRDVALDRPNVVRALGVDVARRRVRERLAQARGAIPAGAAASPVHAWLDRFALKVSAA